MKTVIKNLIKSTLISIGIAMVIFCIVGVIFDIRYGGHFSLDNYYFTKMVAGCVLIGLGFGVPSIVYDMDNLPMPIKMIIHMGIGCVVYTIVAFSIGWAGNGVTLKQGIITIVIQLSVAFLIWFLFLHYYRNEAKKMNDKIKEMNH